MPSGLRLLRGVLADFGADIGVSLVVDDEGYSCLSIGEEFQIHLKYNKHFKGLIFYSELGRLPPTYRPDVLRYYLQLNGSPECDSFTFSFDDTAQVLGLHFFVMKSRINLPRFKSVLELVIARYATEVKRICSFAEGKGVPLPVTTETVDASDEQAMASTLQGLVHELGDSVGISDLKLDDNVQKYADSIQFRPSISGRSGQAKVNQ
jgi:hypothetical protein